MTLIFEIIDQIIFEGIFELTNSLNIPLGRLAFSWWLQDEFLNFTGYNHDDVIAKIDEVTNQDVVDLANLAFEHFNEGGWR